MYTTEITADINYYQIRRFHNKNIITDYYPDLIQSLQEDFTNIIKQNVPCHPSKIKELSDKVQKFHFGDKLIRSETYEELTDVKY